MAAWNLRKHGVSFPEAETVFADPLALELPDRDHSDDEGRWILVGQSYRHRVLVVAFAERDLRVRIISARMATRRERTDHEEGR